MIANNKQIKFSFNDIENDIQLLCEVEDIEREELYKKSRVNSLTLKRALIIALLIECGYSNSEIAKHLNYNRCSTYHCYKLYKEEYAPLPLINEYSIMSLIIHAQKEQKDIYYEATKLFY